MVEMLTGKRGDRRANRRGNMITDGDTGEWPGFDGQMPGLVYGQMDGSPKKTRSGGWTAGRVEGGQAVAGMFGHGSGRTVGRTDGRTGRWTNGEEAESAF